MKRLALIFVFAIIVSFTAIPAAYATQVNTTHLNNIPITSTLKAGTMEWDLIGSYNKDANRGRRVATRLFLAPLDNLEIGMAWSISRPAGPVELAAKYKVLDQAKGMPVSVAIGAQGVTGNWERTGVRPTYYAVLGRQDIHLLGWWDLYVGYANNPMGLPKNSLYAGYIGTEDNSFFGGVKIYFNDDLQVNADYKGYDDSGESVISAGLNYDWVNHIGFAGWWEQDSIAKENTVVLQLAVRGDMKDLKAEVSDPE